jgi:hypothetical protein
MSRGRSGTSSDGSQQARDAAAGLGVNQPIELAGPPAIHLSDRVALRIDIPLTAEPDELLLKELKKSPPLSSLCDGVDVREQSLVLHPNEGGLAAVKTMLAAVVALIETTNQARAEEAMTEDEREAAAAALLRSEVQAELDAWWDEQGPGTG